MHLDVVGHPLHTRSLSVALVQRSDGKLDVRAAIIDLRKRGVVPVGGDIQGPGLPTESVAFVADTANGLPPRQIAWY